MENALLWHLLVVLRFLEATLGAHTFLPVVLFCAAWHVGRGWHCWKRRHGGAGPSTPRTGETRGPVEGYVPPSSASARRDSRSGLLESPSWPKGRGTLWATPGLCAYVLVGRSVAAGSNNDEREGKLDQRRRYIIKMGMQLPLAEFVEPQS
jgi:hypothetical protein